MIFLTLLGIIFCPIFTFACVLIHYGHPGLGIAALIVSFIHEMEHRKEKREK